MPRSNKFLAALLILMGFGVLYIFGAAIVTGNGNAASIIGVLVGLFLIIWQVRHFLPQSKSEEESE